MTTTATRMTAAEFLAWDAPEDDERRFAQLIDGEVVVCSPKPMHQLVELRLAAAMHAWVEAGEGRGLALMTTALPLDERNVYLPDVLWFSEHNVPADLYAYPEAVADLCVEIRSPSTWHYDVGTKKLVYESRGLPELWLVDDIAELVLVFRRSSPGVGRFDVSLELGRGEVLASPMMPGFALTLDELFKR